MSDAQVRLKPITEADLPDYVRWLNDPEVTQFTAMESGNITLEGEREWFARVSDPANPGRTWAIEAEGRHVGNCALHPHGEPNQQSAGFGIAIGDKAAWGKGYGTAAVREALRIGFEEMNLHRIELTAFAPNARAIRCYEKCGFRHEGLKRQGFLKRGRWLDVVVMAILREEWEADRAPCETGAGEVVVRSYRRADYDQVLALWHAVDFHPGVWDSREALDYKTTHDRGLFLVGEAGGRVVGTVMGSWDGRYAWVARLAVAADMRRRGVGRALMAEVESRLAALGADRCLLHTGADNQVAKSFYEGRGYQVVEGIVTMRKLLSASKEECHGS